MDILQSGSSPIDLTRLREWVPDTVVLERLVQVYVKESWRALAEVQAGVLDGNPRRVRDATHSWKTSNAWLGSDLLVELCLEIERVAHAVEFRERGMDVVGRMHVAFEAVRESLATLTSAPRTPSPPATLGEAQ